MAFVPPSPYLPAKVARAMKPPPFLFITEIFTSSLGVQ